MLALHIDAGDDPVFGGLPATACALQFHQEAVTRLPEGAVRGRFDCSERLGEIEQPTLILHGRSDHIAPVALAEQMHARIPNFRVVLYQGGHLFTFTTQREKFVVDVDAFLTTSR